MLSSTKQKTIRQWLVRQDDAIREHSARYDILSDPTRIKILLLLRQYDRQLCVSDIAEILGISVSAVSHQMSLLERSHLITSRKQGKTVCYYLTPQSSSVIRLIHSNK